MHRKMAVGLLAGLLLLAAFAAPAGAAGGARSSVTQAVVTDALQVGNVVPTWGQMIPKLVFDGSWYYATVLDGELYAYPWNGKVYKSPDGVNWSVAAEFSGNTTYQPPGLLLDHKRELHLLVGCYVDAAKPCFPGFTTDNAGAVDFHHVVFREKLADGSFDLTTHDDYSLLDTPNYYMGLAMDKTGRFLYAVYSVDTWDLHVAVFDTVSNTYVHRGLVGTPPASRAWLYAKVVPGNKPGEVHVLVGQYVLGSPNSAVYDQVLLLQSTDNGASWSAPHVVTSVENPDGYQRWVDRSDLAIDASGGVHLLYYRKSDADPQNTLFYQDGLNGSPVGLGIGDNHSQLWIAANGERFIFTTSGTALVVLRSADGVSWEREEHAVTGPRNIYWPTLVTRQTGSVTHQREMVMLVAGQGPQGPAFSHLLMLTYRHLP